MARVAPGEALARFAGVGARFVSCRSRRGGGVLVRLEMPSPELAAWARGVIAGAGLEVGGNDTPWETQVVFTVPTRVIDEMFPGWRQISQVGPVPSGPALPPPPNTL